MRLQEDLKEWAASFQPRTGICGHERLAVSHLQALSRFVAKDSNPDRVTREAVRLRIYEAYLAGEPEPGSRLPSGREMARRWGLDFSTVSRALHDLVREGQVFREGRKYHVPREMRKRPILPPFHATDVVEPGFRALQDLAAVYGTQCVSIDGRDATRLSGRVLQILKAGTGGILLWPPPPELRSIVAAAQMKVPLVACGRSEVEVSWAAPNYREMGRLAVEYLFEQGHREVALLTLPLSGEARTDRAMGYQGACHQLELTASASRIGVVESLRLEDANERIRQLLKEASGIVCLVPEIAFIAVRLLKKMGRRVPADASVISLQDGPECARADPPVSALSCDDYELGRLAGILLLRHMEEVQRVGRTRGTSGLRVEPRLIERGSSGPGPVRKAVDLSGARDQGSAAAVSLEGPTGYAHLSLEERRSIARQTNAGHYAVNRPAGWQHLSLEAWVNRGRQRQGQWFGGFPLLHLASGCQRIHGVPFEIIEEKPERPLSALVLRSEGGVHTLPSEVSIPVQAFAERLYFLHAAGDVGSCENIASYEVHLENGQVLEQPIVALGRAGQGGTGDFEKQVEKAHIQDWWPTYNHFEHETVRHLMVTEDGDPALYERYLYTLEWTNPFPEVRVDQVRVAMAEQTSARLAVLAITALLSAESG